MARTKTTQAAEPTGFDPSIEPAPSKPTTGLPPYRSESIATLTAKARSLHAELAENTAKVDSLNHRNAMIRRELSQINIEVSVHAWDGEPLPLN